MFKKFAITLLSIFLLTFNANAGSDGEIDLNQGQSTDVKDCFEKLNRASFALNQGLDKVVFKPKMIITAKTIAGTTVQINSNLLSCGKK